MAELFPSRRAITDLAGIKAYSIETWGQRVAVDYLAKFDLAFERLKLSPDLLHSKRELSGRLLFYRVEKHWLVCDMIDEDIYVMAIKHGIMDLPKRIAEIEPQLLCEAEIMYQQIMDKME
jgi:plasmid stabilization system protein ParE